ncbi:MAG: anti-sigma factor [bacterium]
MSKRKSPKISELELSRFLDGELSPPDFERVADAVRRFPEHRQAVKRMQAVSALVRHHSRISLTPGEQQSFDTQLIRRMQAPPHVPAVRLRDYLAPVTGWRHWAWPWRMAAALALVLMGGLPFFLDFNSSPEKVFREPLVSDYSNKIFHESNSKAHYDMIWVITEEEEESDSNNPLGLFYFYRA